MAIGILMSIGEVVFTVLIAALVKFITDDISVFVILFFRYLLCIPILLVVAISQRGQDLFEIKDKPKLILRSILGLASFGTLFAALQSIELSTMTALLQTIPIFVTLMAPILIGERVGWPRRIAVLIGFIAVFLIIDPSSKNWLNFGLVLGILSPFFGALMLITLRKLGQTDHPSSTALWYNIIGAISFLLVSIAMNSIWPSNLELYYMLIAIGIMSSFQQIFLSYSHKLAPAVVLAPLRYLSVPFGVVAGMVFFNETLTGSFFIGVGLLVCSSFFIIKRNQSNVSQN